MDVGDRVQFIRKLDYCTGGWPSGLQGEVVETYDEKVWLVRVDGFPLSKVAILEHYVEVIHEDQPGTCVE